MAIEFENPLTAGTVLVRSDIRSQNFVAGTSGWRIEADGDAEFNSIVIRGSTTVGGATLYYNGTPGVGTLLMSIAQAAGVDPFGNNYAAGIAAYKPSGVKTYWQDLNGNVQIGDPNTGEFVFNPTAGTVTSDNGTAVNGQWDAAGSRFRLLYNNGSLSSFAQLQPSAYPQAGDASVSLLLGSLGTAGTLPTTTDINNAGFVQVYSGLNFSSDYQMNLGSPTDRSDSHSSPVIINLGTGSDNIAYSGQVAMGQGELDGSDPSQPIILFVDGVISQSTVYEDVVQIPGQPGGGTTQLVLSGLGLVGGPNGKWMCQVTANTSVPGTDLKYVSYGSASASGVTLRMNRSTDTDTSVSVMLKGL